MCTMPKSPSKPPSALQHRWYLAEWAALKGKIQADAQRELGWSRSTASGLWNGTQRYTQERVDEVASWLSLAPYEILMLPEQAMALRGLRETAYAIAAERGRPFQDGPSVENPPLKPSAKPRQAA